MITTPRFVLRPLTLEDATERYSSWFDDPTAATYIAGAKSGHGIAELRAYIAERAGRADVLFLGIYTRDGCEHIGNIKYEPIDPGERYAVMGILIGEAAWRGRGVAAEVIEESARWLRDERGIRSIRLGVSREHESAIKAYEKIGFRAAHGLTAAVDAMTMVWQLDAEGRQRV